MIPRASLSWLNPVNSSCATILLVLGLAWRHPLLKQAFATNASATGTITNSSNSSNIGSLPATAGSASAGDAISATPAAAMSSAAHSHGTGGFGVGVGGGSGSGSGSGRPVFHEHILQALDSLRQRNVAVFSSAVGNARALALARLGSGGGASQEGGKGLYPCLVQLQCVAEMEEAFEVLSSPASAGEGKGNDDAVDDAVRDVERFSSCLCQFCSK